MEGLRGHCREGVRADMLKRQLYMYGFFNKILRKVWILQHFE